MPTPGLVDDEESARQGGGTTAMAHDIFISYSKDDKATADAVCHGLEEAGIRCWIAPRDVPVGRSWKRSIVQAIREAQAMVLIFSGTANSSSQVHREVDIAFEAGNPILPFRIEAIEMNEDLYYCIGSRHWLDGLTPPLESHIDQLVEAVSTLISHEAPKGPPKKESSEENAPRDAHADASSERSSDSPEGAPAGAESSAEGPFFGREARGSRADEASPSAVQADPGSASQPTPSGDGAEAQRSGSSSHAGQRKKRRRAEAATGRGQPRWNATHILLLAAGGTSALLLTMWFLLRAPEPPRIFALNCPATLGMNETGRFEARVDPGSSGRLATLQWYWDDLSGTAGTPIGARSSRFATHSYDEPGTYTVKVTVTNGASTDETFCEVTVGPGPTKDPAPRRSQ